MTSVLSRTLEYAPPPEFQAELLVTVQLIKVLE